MRLLILLLSLAVPMRASAAPGPFQPIEPRLPTPSASRLGSGHPGPAYWQQRADYELDVSLDEEERRISGRARITYYNRSPHALPYLWLQLDNNIFSRDSDAARSAVAPDMNHISYETLAARLLGESFDGTLKLDSVTSGGQPVAHRVVKTLMRVDPAQPVPPQGQYQLEIRWHYTVNDATVLRARTGYEAFDDGHVIFEIAHWYPRMAVYSELRGWHNDQFLGGGEFSLEFGDFLLRVTVPSDHVVAATGILQNPEEVLSSAERARLASAQTSTAPMYIVTPAEAAAKCKSPEPPGRTKTWVFRARNVRDVAWASSRKFIWDALGVKASPQEERTVLAMSFYPNEAEPLWNSYSTRAIAHTLDVYGRHTFPYPYPVAISVNGPVGGMEYPMISFNAPRPKEDGTYYGKADKGSPWRHSKYGLISVIIHEIGHNWFPMIVNSDERRWTWMDEGLNTFLQFLAEQEWEEDYPSRRGFAEDIVEYMQSRRQVPIMTTSESLIQFGNNAYAKPATALNVLRETVLGREIFDDAFRRYAQAWRFRRPLPGDFFRIMEDASGIDLDWFWNGWFYSTDHVDIAVGTIREWSLDSRDPRRDKLARRRERDAKGANATQLGNANSIRLVQRIESLKDFYSTYDPLDVTSGDLDAYEKLLEELDDDEKALLETRGHFYTVDFYNRGGLVMPIIVEVRYEGGDTEILRLPAHIWRYSPRSVTKLIVSEKPIVGLTVDPLRETADVDTSNNHWPAQVEKSRFELFKEKEETSPMKKAREAAKEDEEETSSENGAPKASTRKRGTPSLDEVRE
ncbi:MAG: M1 family metallopeptidase [Myxococcota bacterium]